MNNEKQIYSFFYQLYEKYLNNDFVVDKTGVKMLELICPVLKLNPNQPNLDFKVKKTNEKYVKAELDWYNSKSLNIAEIGKHAKIWNDVCDKDGNINSNYGWMIFSDENHNQYQHCINELINNRESRRAVMIYQRPSMWIDYNKNGMNDFVCTDGIQLFIRNNKLIYIIKQRSCDFFYGFFNDFAFGCYVYQKALFDLQKKYTELEIGEIIYVPFSLHIYSRHFQLLEKIIIENKELL